MRINQIRIFDYLYVVIGVPLIFLTIITSRDYTMIKTILLILLSGIAFIEILLKKRINKKMFLYICAFILYFSASLLIGILLGYQANIESVFPLVQYYIVTPIVIFLFYNVCIMHNHRIMFVIRFIIILTFILCLLDFLKVLSVRNMIPKFGLLDLILQSSDVNDKYGLVLRMANETSFFFLLPFSIVLLLNDNMSKSYKYMNYMSIILGVSYCVISGRKALEIIVAVVLIIVVVKKYCSIKNTNDLVKNILLLIFGIIALYVFLGFISDVLQIENIIDEAINTLVNGLDSKTYGVIKRNDNISALFDMWLTSPIIGHGLNSYANASLASSTALWSYEVYYNALIAQSGIVGLFFVMYPIYYICRHLYLKFKYYQSKFFLAILIAHFSFAISAGTNPMLYLFWPWTISLICIHYNNETI